MQSHAKLKMVLIEYQTSQVVKNSSFSYFKMQNPFNLILSFSLIVPSHENEANQQVIQSLRWS